MQGHLLLVFAAGFLVAADEPKDDAVKRDSKALQGNWTVVSIEVNGTTVPKDKIGGRDATFKGDQYSIHSFRLTVKIDPIKQPKTIDMDGKDGNGKPLSMTGIYDLDGDTLKICFAKPGTKERPAQFKTRPRTGESLIVYKRRLEKE
ncbi:MAG TPA: TIGR03067 domain-containing protein [Gemmataceae bacterium]|nr:TIGR03067 domain-containing protein [Gemmataceae bacterium]